MRPLTLLLTLSLCAASVVAQKVPYNDFIDTLAEKVRLRDEKGYDRTVKENSDHVILHFTRTARSVNVRPDDEGGRAVMERLKESWQRVFRGEFLEKVERWVAGNDPAQLKKFDQTVDALSKAYNEINRLKSNTIVDRAPWETLSKSVMQICESFEYFGNAYRAAEAWSLVAVVYIGIPSKSLEDRKESVFAMERFVDHRKAWDLTKDRHYISNANWLKDEKVRIEEAEKKAGKRAEAGYSEDVKGAEAYLVVDADKSEVVLPLTFKALNKPLSEMCVRGGPLPMRWNSVFLQGKGPTQLTWFKGVDLYIARPGNNKFGLTLNGAESNLKKNKLTLVPAASKIKKPGVFPLDPKGDREYAMWFYLPSNAEPFQGMSQNFAAVPDRATVYYRSASSWVANIDGTPITLYDDNANGKLFEPDPMELAMSLRTLTPDPKQEVKVPTFDGMKIGKGRKQPWSEWAKIGEAWFHLRSQSEGRSIGVRKTNPEFFKTGSLKLDYGAAGSTKVDVCVVQGKGDFSGARFDLSKGKPIEVPVGSYTLQFGRIYQGKGSRLITADFFPGDGTEEVVVEEGKEAVLKLGAPYQLEFERGGEGRDVEIHAFSIHPVGAAGERYIHVSGAVPSAEIIAAKDASGKGGKVIGEFVAMTDPELASKMSRENSNLGFAVGYYPLVKGVSEGSFAFTGFAPDGSVIGLEEEKNKLFGKLLPIFK